MQNLGVNGSVVEPGRDTVGDMEVTSPARANECTVETTREETVDVLESVSWSPSAGPYGLINHHSTETKLHPPRTGDVHGSQCVGVRTVKVNRQYTSAVSIKVPVEVNGKQYMAPIDSGSEVTVWSSDEYLKIPENSRPKLHKPSLNLVVAEKERELQCSGVAYVKMKLGSSEFEWPLYVVPISDALLLGADILDEKELMVSSKHGLYMEGRWIPCQVTRRPVTVQPKVAVLRLSTNVVVPPRHELIAFADRPQEIADSGDIIMEPAQKDGRGVLIARTLLNSSAEQLPVRLTNVTEQPMKIEKGYQLGHIVPADVVTPIPPSNPVQVRKISADKKRMPDLDFTDVPENLNIISQDVLEQEAADLPAHVVGLYTGTAGRIEDPALRRKLHDILTNYSDTFSRNSIDIGRCNVAEHYIDTGFAAPVREKVRPTPRAFQGEEEQCIKDQLAAGVISPSISPWASGTVLVRKPDGKVRYCIDYRNLNARTVKNSHPLPKISTCLDALVGVNFFSCLDLQSAYWSVPLEESSQAKTAFITKYGLFQYNRMPFGLSCAGATFQRIIEEVMRGAVWNWALAYLDDCILLSSTILQGLERLEEALSRFRKAGMKFKPSKCQLLRRSVLFLGHIVSGAGMRPNPKLVEVIRAWEAPRNKKEVLSYMGLVNYYRKFVPNFSDVAAPLTELTGKTVEFQWSTEAQTAFESLKRALLEAPILSFPRDEGEFVLDTDASNYGIGAVLSQVQDGEERVIAYGSKKLDKAQRRYCVTRRELLAVVVFLKEFRHHLLGRNFLIRTDHASLVWLLRFKEPQNQLARWFEYIFQFDFRIQHRAGDKHGNADGLSRPPDVSCDEFLPRVELTDLPCGGCGVCARQEEAWKDFHENVDNVKPLSCRQILTRSAANSSVDPTKFSADTSPGIHRLPEAQEVEDCLEAEKKLRDPPCWIDGYDLLTLREAQEEDRCIGKLLEWLEAGSKPDRDEAAALPPEARCYWLSFEIMRLINGLAYMLWFEGNKPAGHRLVVPLSLRGHLLDACHNSLLAGHLGVTKTVQRVKQRFYWPHMASDVKLHIRSCEVCASANGAYKSYRAKLADFRVGAPLDRIAVDILGPLRTSSSGNKYILVLCCYFTRWVECWALPDQKAETIAERIVLDFICRFGAPLELHSDQGKNFTSVLLKEVCRLLEITKTQTSSYHPAGNGLVERFNRTLADMLRKYVSGAYADWDRYLPFVTAAYRATVHPATGYTPNYLMLGREVTMPVDLSLPSVISGDADVTVYAAEMKNRLLSCYETARLALKKSAVTVRKYHDTRVNEKAYIPGDIVFRKEPRDHKLCSPWSGPFVIIRAACPSLYIISGKSKTYAVHHDRLKPFPADKLPSWAQKLRASLQESLPVAQE